VWDSAKARRPHQQPSNRPNLLEELDSSSCLFCKTTAFVKPPLMAPLFETHGAAASGVRPFVRIEIPTLCHAPSLFAMGWVEQFACCSELDWGNIDGGEDFS